MLRRILNTHEPVITSIIEDAILDQGTHLLIYDGRDLHIWSDAVYAMKTEGQESTLFPLQRLLDRLSGKSISISTVVVNLNAAFSAARKELVKK
jgi:hypothetical protein